MQTTFGIEHCMTQYDLSQLQHNNVHDIFGKNAQLFKQIKSQVFDSEFISASDLDELPPISTSLDFITGPLYPREVLSIEGPAGSGKTRICLKISYDVALAGRVLYIDSNFSLTPPILASIYEQFHLTSIPNSIGICNASSVSELFSIINEKLSEKIDLIVIDSMMSILQSSFVKDGPGFAQLEQVAEEIKKIAKTYNICFIVTNGIKSDGTTFLGRQYGYLWHSRLKLATRNSTVYLSSLISSHEPLKNSSFYIHNLKPSDEEIVPSDISD